METRRLTEPQVCKRYNRSAMAIWRWRRDPKLGFPQAIYINGRKYTDESELDAFDARQATTPTPEMLRKRREQLEDARARRASRKMTSSASRIAATEAK